MTVYVDDFRTPVTVNGFTGKWSHLTADTKEELHEFAAKLGLKRAWFQEPKGAVPGSYHAESWHYDVVERFRQLAIEMGAQAIGWRDMPDIIHARMERQGNARQEEGQAEG